MVQGELGAMPLVAEAVIPPKEMALVERLNLPRLLFFSCHFVVARAGSAPLELGQTPSLLKHRPVYRQYATVVQQPSASAHRHRYWFAG